jgi:D-arabinose 1-dehydrogenase-like Zn-dependent alcohol dehydrogenase
MDMEIWTEALRPEGVFVQLGAAPQPLDVGAFGLIMGYRSLAGSAIAHPALLRDMLDFAARTGVEAQVQLMPMDQCNEAMAITRAGSARYRVVLER